MIGVVLVFALCWGFGVVAFFGDMKNAISAPQQCVAIGIGLFTLLAPYTAMRAFQCWRSTEDQKELLEAVRKLSERPQA